MKQFGYLIIAVLFWNATVHAGQREAVDTNKLANFITIKEFTHCAEYHIRVVDIEKVAGQERARRVQLAGDFLGQALNIDEAMTAVAMPYAKQYFSTLNVNELHARYKNKCGKLVNDRRFRTRMLDWRYRLNALQHVPPAFFNMRWEGQMPEEWYPQK